MCCTCWTSFGVVLEYPFDTTEPRSDVVSLLAWLKGLASVWDLSGYAMLTGSLAVALLFASVAFGAAKWTRLRLPVPREYDFGSSDGESWLWASGVSAALEGGPSL